MHRTITVLDHARDRSAQRGATEAAELLPLLHVVARRRWRLPFGRGFFVDARDGVAYVPARGRWERLLDLSPLLETSDKERAILGLLRDRELTQFQIRDALALTGAWTSRLLNGLLQRGLVVGVSDPDGARLAWGALLRRAAEERGARGAPKASARSAPMERIAAGRFRAQELGGVLAEVLGWKAVQVELVYAPAEPGSAGLRGLGVGGLSSEPRAVSTGQADAGAPRAARDDAQGFSGMGNEPGWDEWTRNGAAHFGKLGLPVDHVLRCPKRRFEAMIRDRRTLLYYHLCHGGSESFTAGDRGSILESEVRMWMEARPPMRFTFIGSCGGMDSTGYGTLSYAFSKGDESVAVVGYTGMGAPGSGWRWSVRWQDELFGAAIDEGVTVYEALLRAQSRVPQMSRNWGFWGNRGFLFWVHTREETSERAPGDRHMKVWKRARAGVATHTVHDLEARSRSVLVDDLAELAEEFVLERREQVVEEDSGAVRQGFVYQRTLMGAKVEGDYVSIELDPTNGELIGYTSFVTPGLQVSAATAAAACFRAGEARRAARDAAPALLREHGAVAEGFAYGEPELVYTTRLPDEQGERFLAWDVPVTFSRDGRESVTTSILIDPASGEVRHLIPPPPT
jgi:hypothetical protein